MKNTGRRRPILAHIKRAHPGKEMPEILREALARHDTPEGAAGELGISRTTLANWQAEFLGSEEPEAEAAAAPAGGAP